MIQGSFLDDLTARLEALGYRVESISGGVRAHHPERLAVYEVFGEDEIAERCCYVNGVMVDLDALAVIRDAAKWPET